MIFFPVTRFKPDTIWHSVLKGWTKGLGSIAIAKKPTPKAEETTKAKQWLLETTFSNWGFYFLQLYTLKNLFED